MSHLILYIQQLVSERLLQLAKNSGNNTIDRASNDHGFISANAKAEQIVDDLVRLYQCVKDADQEAAQAIKDALMNTQYFCLLN